MERIAVVGSGISGLAAAWLLSRRYRVTLFEAERRLGGHSHTVAVSLDGKAFPVDTGFLVFNHRTYPNLTALFETLGVQTVASEMSFSVSLAEPRLEWAGSSLTSLFAQRRNLMRPQFWSMLQDILRFNRETSLLAREGAAVPWSLQEYLDREGYGRPFRDWYLLPMAAAIWSCPTGQMLEYPLSTFVRFCHNHGLLQIFDRPQWLTVGGGSREYVARMAQALDDVRLGTPVIGLRRDETGVSLQTAAGSERFDHLVLACHSDQALRLIGNTASGRELALLESIRYQPNRAVLHHDPLLLPSRRAAWAAWNYSAGAGEPGTQPVSVSYLINRLQPLPVAAPVVVSLNPHVEPRPDYRIADFEYDHPVFDRGAIAAQQRLPELQGWRRTWFCGAWTGYGFHEDGLNSALAVSAALGVEAPWKNSASIPAEPELRAA